MNGRVFLQTEHVELSLTPNLEEGVVVTASAHPPHATGRRGVTLHFTLEPQDTAHLAELLEKTAPLADPAGGAA